MSDSTSMWAFSLSGPARLAPVEVPAPDPQSLKPGQVIVRLLVGGICGSDLPFFKGLAPSAYAHGDGPPRRPVGSPLHEIVGEIVASADPDLRRGALVVGWASSSNGLSEFVVTDGEGLFEYDPQFAPETAIMLQPLACVISALNRISGIPGARVAVIGQGPIGVLFCHVLKAYGAAVVTGVDRIDRSDLADAFHVDDPVHASSDWWAGSLEEAERPSIVIETVGHQVTTLRDAINALAFGGHLYYFGMPDDAIYPFPMMTFLRKNARMTSGVTRDRKISLAKANDYLKAEPELAASYLTNLFPIEEVQRAFELAVQPAPGRLKVALKVNASPGG